MEQFCYLCIVISSLNYFHMKFSEFYRLLESNGWVKKEGARHAKYVHPDFDYFIPVGRHPSHEVPSGTLRTMMKQAGLK